ncbi:MAG: DUF5661 family protein [Bacteroidota bacterium]|jgi:DNA topoisomerase-1
MSEERRIANVTSRYFQGLLSNRCKVSVEDYTTKDGRPIKFKVHERSPLVHDPSPENNRGWVVHLIEAFVDGKEVGYLKISYIPKAYFGSMYKSIWHYSAWIQGWGGDIIKFWEAGDIDNLLRLATVYFYGYWKDFSDMPQAEKVKELKSIEKKLLPDFQKFQQWTVDKPIVDYIRVDETWRRQGIATALYTFGAKWLAQTKHLPLHASTLQQPGAAKAWDRMEQRGMPIKHFQQTPARTKEPRDRRKLDYTEQIARVASRYKDKIPGGLSEGGNPSDFETESLAKGRKVEMEHTNDPGIAREIAMDHLTEDPEYYDKLEKIEKSASMLCAKYQKKKKIKTKDGEDAVVYVYSERQIANRNKAKAEKIEKLRGKIDDLRKQIRKDLKSDDPKVRACALAVGLMDLTYERIGNSESASEGHFGVTGWRKKHLTFGKGKVTIKYVGKSGVDHEKVVDAPESVKALQGAVKDKGDNDEVVDCSAEEVNGYLEQFSVTAKDLRGYHANREMQERLKSIRSKGGKLPSDKKEKEKKLKEEFKQALEETAEAVGHEPATLKSQYLVPGLAEEFLEGGEVTESLKKASTDLAMLKPNDVVQVYHGTNYEGFARMANGIDAMRDMGRLYGGGPHRGLFVTPDWSVAEGFSSSQEIVMGLKVYAKFLHGVENSGNLRDGQDKDFAGKYPKSFRPSLSFTLLDSGLEPQAIYLGYLKPSDITSVWVKGKKMSREEAIQVVAEKLAQKTILEDYGVDLTSPKLSLKDFIHAFVRHGDGTETELVTTLRETVEHRGPDKAYEGLVHGEWGVEVGEKAARNLIRQVELLKKGSATEVILRPEGWGSTGPEGYAFLRSLDRPGHVYRGMEEAEYRVTVGAHRPVGSKNQFSFSSEGTNFAEDALTAEDYPNFGHSDPRKTGKSNYLVEVVRTDGMIRNRQGYIESHEPVPYGNVSRVWEMRADGDRIVARQIKTASTKEWTLKGFFRRHPALKRYAGIRVNIIDLDRGPEARQEFDHINLYAKFQKYPESHQDWIFAHEIGHWVLSEYGLAKFIEDATELGVDVWDTHSLPRGQTNMQEAFADCFSEYFIGKATQRLFPAWAKLVEKQVKTVSKFALLRPLLSKHGSSPRYEPVHLVSEGNKPLYVKVTTKPDAVWFWRRISNPPVPMKILPAVSATQEPYGHDWAMRGGLLKYHGMGIHGEGPFWIILQYGTGTPDPEPTKKCPGCGKDLPESAGFCPECGTRQKTSFNLFSLYERRGELNSQHECPDASQGHYRHDCPVCLGRSMCRCVTRNHEGIPVCTASVVCYDCEERMKGVQKSAKKIDLSQLGLVSHTEEGTHFVTGSPVSFHFIHNPAGAPNMGARFGQNIEPTGMYLLAVFDKGTEDHAINLGWDVGEISFHKPLVLSWIGYGEDGWKSRLSKAYGKTRGALTRALISDGYDGIVTVGSRGTSEIVSLAGKIQSLEK